MILAPAASRLTAIPTARVGAKEALPLRSPLVWQTALTPMDPHRSEEHTSELQSPCNLVCRLLLEKKKTLHHAIPVFEAIKPSRDPLASSLATFTLQAQPLLTHSQVPLQRQAHYHTHPQHGTD